MHDHAGRIPCLLPEADNRRVLLRWQRQSPIPIVVSWDATYRSWPTAASGGQGHGFATAGLMAGRWSVAVAFSAVGFGGRARWAIYLVGFLRRAARTRGRSLRSPRMTYST
jgi:hypothetical protein